MRKLLLVLAILAGFILVTALLYFKKQPVLEGSLPFPVRISPVPTPTSSPWLSYLNDHYSYSINYPRGWEKTEWEFHEATQLDINRKQQEGMIWQQTKFEGKERSFQVLVWVNRQKAATPQWLRWYRHQDLDLKKIPTAPNYQISGKDAYLMFSGKTSWGYSVIRIFFSRGEYIFELIAQNPNENLEKIYMEMIQSFKLLE
ncbi:MAG: hypothetical protein Q8P89_03935 [bacterium]|nr:hypothetical protein [bacterium]